MYWSLQFYSFFVWKKIPVHVPGLYLSDSFLLRPSAVLTDTPLVLSNTSLETVLERDLSLKVACL